MLRTLAARSPARRRGAVLIVVLAMLVLFAVLGLSFVLYAESQASASKSNKDAENKESEPNPAEASRVWLGYMLYGVGDTGDELMIPVRGHDFARSKYGYQATVAKLLPFGATNAIPAEDTTFMAANFNGIGDSRQIVRFTWDTNSSRVFDPERYYDFANMMQPGTYRTSPNTALVDRTNAAGNNGMYVGKNYGFTYPDRHDFYLAQINPATGEIVVPSFHRPDLFTNTDPTYAGNTAAQIAQSLNPNNPKWRNEASPTGDLTGRWQTLRPRSGPAGSVCDHPNFPQVPMDPDGQYRGDVSNLKFITGVQKNDSLWMYTGGPVLRWRGKNYVACVAPLILDLSSRVNLSVAGNVMNYTTDNARPHGSNQGWGPWEVNPMQVGLTTNDLQEIVARRHGRATGTFTPPADPFTTFTRTARINGIQHPQFTGGKLPSGFGLIDADGCGPLPGMMPPAPDGPLYLPQQNTPNTTPLYNFNNTTNTAPYRYEPTQASLLDTTTFATGTTTNHPAQFNPLLYTRTPNPTTSTPGGFGHDDFIKLFTHYSDPKGRPGQVSSIPTGTTLATNNQLRQLVTTFSTSQQWAGVQVRTGPNATDVATLGPIDLNRPLRDFRKNPTLPHSPVNIWDPNDNTVADLDPAEKPFYDLAVADRQRLARDIFIRLAGRYGLIDGQTMPAGATYLPATGTLQITGPITNTKVQSLAILAQLAVNLVDYIDGDDIVTMFVWRPADATIDPYTDPNNFSPTADMTGEIPLNTRVAYGTEKPRLVINEVFSGLFNNRAEDTTPPAISMQRLERRYWVELHNPLPNEPTDSAAHGDLGAARLRYDPATTTLPNPAGGAAIPPTANLVPYRVEVAVIDPPMMGIAQPYTSFLNSGGTGAAVADTGGATVFAGALKARVQSFVHDATAPSTASALAGDEFNMVRPIPAPPGTSLNGSNLGYFLLGPKDPFPAAGTLTSMSLPDTTGVGPPPMNPPVNGPVDTLRFDTTTGAVDEAGITTEANKSSVVLLRRLLNPYLPAQENSTLANYNPYITVDYLENVPTRDRVKVSSAGPHTPATADQPSVGRIHPYAAAPVYQSPPPMAAPFTAVRDQVNGMATPAHTFFAVNNPADNNRTVGTATLGFEWLVHLDRELVSQPEAAHASLLSPALLTQRFYTGSGYHGQETGLANQVVLPQYPTTPVYPLAECAGLLGVGSRLPGVPFGGRETGKINANTMNNVAVFNAVLDPTHGGNPNYANSFTTTNPGYATTVWDAAIQPPTNPAPNIARTPNGVPRATVHEGGTDYPFNWGGAYSTYTDTPFGRRTTDPSSMMTGPQVFPNSSATGSHPYLMNEPLRKAYNNLSPNSDSFLVLMTVGFFEVDNTGPWSVTNQPQLGRELFDKVPGDLRAQFGGIVDRSQLFTDIVQFDTTTGWAASTSSGVALDASNNPTPRAVQTKLVADVIPSNTNPFEVNIEGVLTGGTCSIPGDGVTFVIGVNSLIRVGYGDTTAGGDGEWLTVTGVAQRQLPNASGTYTNVPGQVTLTVAASATARPHGAGAPVGNVIFGNPGPQASPPTLEQLRRRGIVPYFTRIEP